jgi:transcriptional regulator with PAS, ATPase and Fis domain
MLKRGTAGNLELAQKNDYTTLLLTARPVMLELSAMTSGSTVCVADRQGNILEAIRGTYLSSKPIDPRQITSLKNFIQMALAEKKPIEFGGNGKGGKNPDRCNFAAAPLQEDHLMRGVLCLVNPRPLPSGILQTVACVARILSDTTRKIEKELAEKINLYSITDYLECGVIVVDGKGKIVNVNKKFQELIGVSNRNLIIGQLLRKYIPNSKQFMESLNVEGQHYGYRFKLKTGTGLHGCFLRVKQTVYVDADANKNLILFSFSKEPEDLEEYTEDHNHLFTFQDIVGESKPWIRVKEFGLTAARVTSNVLLIGESGTGKEMMAQAIHKESNRTGPFVPINCGAIPKELLQSELFGYESGAFTGAKRGGAEGRLEEADGGTVFLDEIGEMSMDMQVSLLRFLQDKTITRVGGTRPRKIDVRIIAATNRDLEEAIISGEFREDLFYRLNVITIKLPLLRQRKEDIPLLVDNLVNEFCLQLKKDVPQISQDTFDVLLKYNWPGNVRELRNVIEYAVVFTPGDMITPSSLPQRLLQKMESRDLTGLKRYEFNIIQKTLAENNGNISQTAKALGITRSTLYRKIKQMKQIPSVGIM